MKLVLLETIIYSHVEMAAPLGRSGARGYAPSALLRRIVATMKEWRCRSRERAQLAMLDERMLRDIGVNRTDLWRETNKPFWRQ